MRQALGSLLQVLSIEPLHAGALEASAQICRVLGSTADAELFDALAVPVPEPEALFSMGYHLVGQGRADVAVAYLRLALANAPDDAASMAARRELAYAQLQSRDFGGCVTTLSEVSRCSDLAEAEQLDTDLLAAEAALYQGRLPLSRQFLDAADARVPNQEQQAHIDALHALLGRAARWGKRLNQLGLREWHHIQHAGVILKTAGGWFEDGSLGGRFELLELRADMIAFLLERLGLFLTTHRLLPEVVVPAGDLSAPLAMAFAERFGAQVLADPGERGDRRALLLAASAGELEPWTGTLARHHGDLAVASLALDWDRDAPLCPDIVGVLARRAFLPWEPRYSVDPSGGEGRTATEDSRPAAAIAVDLVAAMAALPDDGGKARDEFESFYDEIADELVLGRADNHPLRRQFTQLSPAWTSTSKRPANHET